MPQLARYALASAVALAATLAFLFSYQLGYKVAAALTVAVAFIYILRQMMDELDNGADEEDR